jgi:hypothetical protein
MRLSRNRLVSRARRSAPPATGSGPRDPDGVIEVKPGAMGDDQPDGGLRVEALSSGPERGLSDKAVMSFLPLQLVDAKFFEQFFRIMVVIFVE